MIIVRNLSKVLTDGQTILSKVSFQIDKGEFIAVIGASGSGKSTLLGCLALRQKWTEGQLIVDGTEFSGAKWADRLKLRKEWAFLEERPALALKKTALKNVFSGRFWQLPWWRKITGTVSTEEHIRAMDYLERVGLLDKAKMLPAEKLSGGEQQRVAIAKGLAQGAKVILADEPTKGLDPESASKVLQDLRALCTEQNMIVVCAMQNLEMAERNASRIWGLSGGKLVLDIPARKLTQREKDLVL
ncbi:phosphonate ABC transporter ATP-binding protein [Paenibacillus flagellatus]|uniref:Phosphonate ABC transporter ATP-binding protein n=1 Tax=Paenibacillus flagellatus TaxID=2211139 RepID=A0A2V5KLE3_9BACL|nr:ATP-binding cassette domain-containing protein [Paenibacillus flagellatus]PYI55820.1 phosphonate ABC transporter ATP-binding protein [Paenibacillus flagellatus]